MIHESERRGFKGVWIPGEIWLQEDLSCAEKCLLTEINSLDNDERGCWASNEYLGKFIKVTAGRCANIISDLRKRGFLYTLYNDGQNRGLRLVPLHENVNTPSRKREAPLHENVNTPSRKREHSNTVSNTVINTEREEGVFANATPPRQNSSMEFVFDNSALEIPKKEKKETEGARVRNLQTEQKTVKKGAGKSDYQLYAVTHEELRDYLRGKFPQLPTLDVEAYHDALCLYSANKGAMYANWLLAAANWVRKDIAAGKVRMVAETRLSAANAGNILNSEAYREKQRAEQAATKEYLRAQFASKP